MLVLQNVDMVLASWDAYGLLEPILRVSKKEDGGNIFLTFKC
jgi:hypothetical protein